MENATRKTHTITFAGEASELADVRACVRKFLEDSSLTETDTARIVMAVDEACTNIIRHAPQATGKPVHLEMQRVPEKLRFVLLDQGTPIAKDSIPQGHLNPTEQGGMGGFIIRQVFDQVEYKPETDGTRLTLEKRIPVP